MGSVTPTHPTNTVGIALCRQLTLQQRKFKQTQSKRPRHLGTSVYWLVWLILPNCLNLQIDSIQVTIPWDRILFLRNQSNLTKANGLGCR